MRLENNKKLLSGTVVSNKMNKTIVVSVVRKVKDSLLKKYIKKTSKYFVHDENNQAQVGDVVNFQSCRPISKRTTWQLVKTLASE